MISRLSVPTADSFQAPSIRTNVMTTAGFVLYCAYLLSGFANDWSSMLFGRKAYLSTVVVVLLPLFWLLSGNAARGLHHGIGRWWLAFAFWLLLATPFSVWKGGSTQMLFNYIPRSYLCFFYSCSFVTSLRRCRYLMYVNILSAILLLLTCVSFGDSGTDLPGERFRISGSLFYANSNDLALTLLLGTTAFLFLFFRKSIAARIVGCTGIILSTVYALKTGSRGCLIAGVAMLVVIFLLSRSKITVALLALPIAALALLSLPASTLHRLSLLLEPPGTTLHDSTSDQASRASEFQRQGLLKKSLDYTLAHPLFGVGPDQFATAVFREASRDGQHVAWLGTHNSYTQVSSECGIPALIFYCISILLCFRLNYRLYRRTRGHAEFREVAGLSLSLLAATVVYSLGTFFFHIAYGSSFPALAGFSVAVHCASKSLLDGSSTFSSNRGYATAVERFRPTTPAILRSFESLLPVGYSPRDSASCCKT